MFPFRTVCQITRHQLLKIKNDIFYNVTEVLKLCLNKVENRMGWVQSNNEQNSYNQPCTVNGKGVCVCATEYPHKSMGITCKQKIVW